MSLAIRGAGWFVAMCTLISAYDQPNILFLLADDQGYSDLSSYGSENINSPEIDQLAADGIRFTDFYSAASNCSPARTGSLTGRTPSRVGMYSYVPGSGTGGGDGPLHLPAQEITIAKLLNYAGYQTAHVGKWHQSYDMLDATQPQPLDHGFDYSLGTMNNAGGGHLDPDNWILNGEMHGTIQGYSCQIVADTIIGWLERRDTEKPFFVAGWFHEPHDPIESPPELVANHSGGRAEYYANIENLDIAVGRILDGLDDMGLTENTLVVYASDNGSVSNQSNQPLRGVKSNMWDGGIREPGIFKWPGVITPGSETDVPASLVDLFPTFAAAAAVPMPTDRTYDGVNLIPLLTGGEITREKPLYWFFYRVDPSVAIRVGDWSLVGFLEGGRPAGHAITSDAMTWLKQADVNSFQLYNMRDDIGQSNDLSDQEPAKLQEMQDLLVSMHTQVIENGPNWYVPGEPTWDGDFEPPAEKTGCRDQDYTEYDATANLHVPDLCITSDVIYTGPKSDFQYRWNSAAGLLWISGEGVLKSSIQLFDLQGTSVLATVSKGNEGLKMELDKTLRGVFILRITKKAGSGFTRVLL